MIFMVLRAQDPSFPVDTFLSRHSVQASYVWRKGEPRRRGLTHEDSGFSIQLPDVASWVVGLPSVKAYIESRRHIFEDLQQIDAEVVLDIGVTVGEEESYAPSLSFPKDFLALLITLGINLNVSAYPTAAQAGSDMPRSGESG